MLQLARKVLGLGEPVRQYPVEDEAGNIVAYADLAWPEIGLFIELDGEQHKGQPVYDASRETLIVSLTGWIPGRFTWTEVVHLPTHTARRLAALARQGRGRVSA
jgi:very-short-patch-repair endonuclease